MATEMELLFRILIAWYFSELVIFNYEQFGLKSIWIQEQIQFGSDILFFAATFRKYGQVLSIAPWTGQLW